MNEFGDRPDRHRHFGVLGRLSSAPPGPFWSVVTDAWAGLWVLLGVVVMTSPPRTSRPLSLNSSIDSRVTYSSRKSPLATLSQPTTAVPTAREPSAALLAATTALT